MGRQSEVYVCGCNDGVLDIKIAGATVDTGSGVKDGKLKSKDCFNVEEDPTIEFRSTKVVQTSRDTFDIMGIFPYGASPAKGV